MKSEKPIRRRIKSKTVEEITGFSRWSHNRWAAEGRFPKPHKLSTSEENVWFEDEILEWLEQNTVDATPHKIKPQSSHKPAA
jgi:predicted DNA-binding transcriptional regulator AlpA